jgi:AcrR family transcriptional regulator
VAETRQRIVEAIVALHEEVGPRNTTIKGIAERAGVERLTVYRHFPDDKALYEACASCWLERHPPPDPAKWVERVEAEEVTREAFEAINGYYRKGAPMLKQIYRDVGDIPELAAASSGFQGYLDAIATDLENRWLEEGKSCREEIRSTIVHCLDFTTWESLERCGLSDTGKSELEVCWITSVV